VSSVSGVFRYVLRGSYSVWAAAIAAPGSYTDAETPRQNILTEQFKMKEELAEGADRMLCIAANPYKPH